MFSSDDRRMIDLESRLRIIDSIFVDRQHAGAWEQRIKCIEDEIEEIGSEITDYLDGLTDDEDI